MLVAFCLNNESDGEEILVKSSHLASQICGLLGSDGSLPCSQEPTIWTLS
jgi:hypothetical protein